MKKLCSGTLCVLLAVSSSFAQANSFTQKNRRAAATSATTARFMVRLVFDEEYKSATDKPNEIDASRPHDTGKAETKLHLEMNANRWLKIQPGDGGSTEFVALEGGEPSSATGAVTLEATDESRSDNGTGEKNRVESKERRTANFSGKVASPDVTRDDSPVALYLPQFSDGGGGLEFRLKVNSRMAGGCHLESSWDGGSRNSDDCGDMTIVGLPSTTANTDAGRTSATAYLADIQEDFDFHPAPQTAQPEGGINIEQLEQVPGTWYGAQTRGDRQSGYKISLSKTKTLKHTVENGVQEDWSQKISLDAEIIPGSPTASLETRGAEGLDARDDLDEIRVIALRLPQRLSSRAASL